MHVALAIANQSPDSQGRPHGLARQPVFLASGSAPGAAGRDPSAPCLNSGTPLLPA